VASKEDNARRSIDDNAGRLVRAGVPRERAYEIAKQTRLSNENPGRRDRWLRQDKRPKE